MKQFLKDNSYTVVRMMVFQLGADILGLITAFATGSMSAAWVFPFSSVFCVCFYLVVIASVGYESGQKDGIRIESGKIKKQPWKFFVISLLANALNLILALVAFVCRLAIGAPMSGALDESFAASSLANVQEVCATIARFLQAMYLGIVQSISDRSVILLLLIPFPAILTAGISYLVGIRFKDGFKGAKLNKTDRYS